MKNSIKAICRPLCGALLALAANSAAAQASGKYSFAVVPHYNATELHKGWAPVLQRISRETGLELEIKIAPSIPEFETEFLKGVPDFVYLNPYQAVLAKQAHGYVPLLRESKSLSGILVVRNDSPYRSVRDLKGQTVAFPTLNGFGAVTYLRALLASEEGIRFEARYVKSHANVFRHVIRNEAAAGGSVTRALNHELPDLREQLRIIYKTP